MNLRLRLKSTNLLLAFLLATLPLTTAAIDYKEYKKKKDPESYFKISVDKKNFSVSTPATNINDVKSYPIKKLKNDGTNILIGSTPFVTDLTVLIDEEELNLERIVDTRVLGDDEYISISFFDGSDDTSRIGSVKSGNRIENSEHLSVGQDEFIRGVVFNPGGDIEILGEVNKDVISITGDIYIGPGAVVRGDIVSIKGKVELADDASIYGEIFTFSKKPRSQRGRFSIAEQLITTNSNFIYNRVDGATVMLGARLKDSDSTLPILSISAGYAFESERWRYEFGARQFLFRDPAISIGGTLFRELTADHHWFISQSDNTNFALLATEDYMDYYEAEGGTIFLSYQPIENLNLQSRYRYEETNWIKATPHLFSLFGGDKLFGHNYGRVDEPFRANSIEQIDSTTNVSLSLLADFDNHNKNLPFDFSGWHFTAEYESSTPDLDSDFDYDRYRINLRRYQLITDRSMILLRIMYGGSDGFLPMYKRFYLGGYGSLTGYNHKEFMGTEFWMINSEYRIAFRKSDFAFSLLWNSAQIANDTKLDSDIEVKNDLGVGLYLGSDVRLSLSKRLDRSTDDDLLFHFQFSHKF